MSCSRQQLRASARSRAPSRAPRGPRACRRAMQRPEDDRVRGRCQVDPDPHARRLTVAWPRMRRVRVSPALPLYVGGFIGPFGGAVLAVLIPELREAFGVSTAAVAVAIPAYLVPFALVQLVSGTIGERLGRRRVVRAGYVALRAVLARGRRGAVDRVVHRVPCAAGRVERVPDAAAARRAGGGRGPRAARALGRHLRGGADGGDRAVAAVRRAARRDRLAAGVRAPGARVARRSRSSRRPTRCAWWVPPRPCPSWSARHTDAVRADACRGARRPPPGTVTSTQSLVVAFRRTRFAGAPRS